MVSHPLKPVAFDPKPDDRELDAKRLRLEAPRADLVEADPMLLGMQIGNLIYAAVFGVARRERS
jgi:hypothetical protein